MIPSSRNDIVAYRHCAKCLAELPRGTSAQEYSRLDFGHTMKGVQVWCRRHNCNVINIDHEGSEHPVNTQEDT